MSTVMDAITGQVPKSAMAKMKDDWALSPVKGVPIRKLQLVSHLPFTSIVGGLFIMGPGNAHLVRRSWGLRQWEALDNPEACGSEAYGDEFEYFEFQQAKSWIGALFASLMVISSFGLLLIPPIRWLAKTYLLPQPGQGPSEESLKNGWFKSTNVTETSRSSGQSVRAAKTTIKGTGEVGYLGTSVMTSEIALALLPTWYPQLTHIAKIGGVLTPTAALGFVLKERLESSGRFQIVSEMIDTDPLDRKDR